ncbi:hypothetical protein FF36_05767 [Frankia torreyi]|uniref:Uncharacterized protein n=1 Tax=Frankia torreyi TaxID=1856 RepID=A0A0D8B6P4_9ACTN|nr:MULTISPECIES: hypothetical protein [Frankia]KJE19958.1 hypothetical protein FF36_05767 [Frankia torreyi]
MLGALAATWLAAWSARALSLRIVSLRAGVGWPPTGPSVRETVVPDIPSQRVSPGTGTGSDSR